MHWLKPNMLNDPNAAQNVLKMQAIFYVALFQRLYFYCKYICFVIILDVVFYEKNAAKRVSGQPRMCKTFTAFIKTCYDSLTCLSIRSDGSFCMCFTNLD